MHIICLAREQENSLQNQGNFQKKYQGGFNQEYPQQEVARPILGTQPPPLGIVLVRYVDAKYQKPSMKPVSMSPTKNLVLSGMGLKKSLSAQILSHTMLHTCLRQTQ